MSDLYEEFEDFCSTHDGCKNCKYKDIEHCHFYWSADKARAEERDRIISELENRIAEETLGSTVSDVGIGLEIAFKIVRGGEND